MFATLKTPKVKPIDHEFEYLLANPIFRGAGYKGTTDDGNCVEVWVTHYTPKPRQTLRRIIHRYCEHGDASDIQVEIRPSNELQYAEYGVEVLVTLPLKCMTMTLGVEMEIIRELRPGVPSLRQYSLGWLPHEKGIDRQVRMALQSGAIIPSSVAICKLTDHAPHSDATKQPLYNVKLAIPYRGNTIIDGEVMPMDRASEDYQRLEGLII
jgi:hypothetical protein